MPEGIQPTPSGNPITVGISVPTTGAFQADGIATRNGYELWASDVNRNGGLLGRQVKLIFRNDNSDPKINPARTTSTLIQPTTST